MHPLPRVGELDAAFDSDRRAVYFEQAAYGVPVRMALISLLLGLKGKSLHRFEGGFERDEQNPVYDQPRSVGLHCANTNCIVHDPMEAQYVRNKFYVVKPASSARSCAASIASATSSTSWSPARRTNGTRPTLRRCGAAPTTASRTSSCSPTRPTRRRPASIPGAPPPSPARAAARRRASKL